MTSACLQLEIGFAQHRPMTMERSWKSRVQHLTVRACRNAARLPLAALVWHGKDTQMHGTLDSACAGNPWAQTERKRTSFPLPERPRIYLTRAFARYSSRCFNPGRSLISSSPGQCRLKSPGVKRARPSFAVQLLSHDYSIR